MRKLIDYLLPRRKVWRVPKEITARYHRDKIPSHLSLVMAAGLARDPAKAAIVWGELVQEKGVAAAWDDIRLYIYRRRTQTIRERFMMLMRRVTGEREPIIRHAPPRKRDPIVNVVVKPLERIK